MVSYIGWVNHYPMGMDSPLLDDHASGSTRRAFLTRSAAGAAVGGLIWVAPSVLTVDAAAAASCGVGTHTLSWGDATSATLNLDGALPNSTTATVSGDTIRTAAMGGVTATITYTNPNGVANSTTANSLGTCFSVINNQIGANAGKSWYMQMKATAVNQHLTTTLTFRKAGVLIGLNALTFTMYDIDKVNGTGTLWTDRIVVTGTLNGTPVPLTATKAGAGANSPVIAGSGTNAVTATGGGNLNIDPSSNAGNVTFVFSGPVDTVLIDYIAPDTGSVTSNPFQFTALSNVTWTTCA
jgi:hypothetical protein